MTLEEISKKYNYSLNSLQTNFSRSRDSIYKKYGVRIIKEGRGKNAIYREQIISDNREETMFKALEPLKNMGAMQTDLGLPNFTFNVFMGVITTPMFVFRGTYKDFLGYLEIPSSEQNVEALKNSINELVNMMIINEIIDTTTEDEVITLSLVRKAEIEMKINVNMIIMCKMLAQENNMKSWVPLLKVWLGTEFLSRNNGTFQRLELQNITGLTEGMVDKCNKILQKNNVYKKQRIYTGFSRCIGSSVDMNNQAFIPKLSETK